MQKSKEIERMKEKRMKNAKNSGKMNKNFRIIEIFLEKKMPTN